MITQQEKEMVFKLWSSLGVSLKNLKLIGVRFKNFEEYFKTICEFYNIEGGVVGLEQHIINESNEILKEYGSPCEGINIRLVRLDLLKGVTSSERMDSAISNISNKYTAQFGYTDPGKWKCSDAITDTIYNSYEDCFNGECLEGPSFDVTRHILKKYGISTNIDMVPESMLRGNIKISKW